MAFDALALSFTALPVERFFPWWEGPELGEGLKGLFPEAGILVALAASLERRAPVGARQGGRSAQGDGHFAQWGLQEPLESGRSHRTPAQDSPFAPAQKQVSAAEAMGRSLWSAAPAPFPPLTDRLSGRTEGWPAVPLPEALWDGTAWAGELRAANPPAHSAEMGESLFAGRGYSDLLLEMALGEAAEPAPPPLLDRTGRAEGTAAGQGRKWFVAPPALESGAPAGQLPGQLLSGGLTAWAWATEAGRPPVLSRQEAGRVAVLAVPMAEQEGEERAPFRALPRRRAVDKKEEYNPARMADALGRLLMEEVYSSAGGLY